MNLFDAFLSAPASLDVFEGRNFVAAMLAFESALVEAQAAEGLVPASASALIQRVCADLDAFDTGQIARDSGRAGSVAIPLVKALKQRVHEADPAALPHVHLGATSQDVIDTAMALLSRRAIDLLIADLRSAAQALLALAVRHADTPVLARTLMQPASVTSLGLKAANWAAPLVRSLASLGAAADRALQLQLGGAVGTLAQMQGQGPAVAKRMAASLGLTEPHGAWHTQRDLWVLLGCELGVVAGSLGKIAGDIALMSQFEVGEISEPTEEGRGGSSAMPHKRNPVASMVALAAAARVPGLVATLLGAMTQVHERALGPWQAELATWPQLVLAVHGSVQAMAGALPGLVVDAARMRANIETLRQQIPAEAAEEWFSPALALQAGSLARDQVRRLNTDQALAINQNRTPT
ncbi:3-carboxy-cis,cis-muconate cycloisomerase [Xylophilus rhododendri]|uniref:3-carboxy-cis,cis-muconate cycloisomerase n=1 Tax=Xylophilus rhododendri TaxID=2697032 RepID=A0A857J9G6_9BURK|nr:lyase family protein [Xylophilus rhododendri]QHJ00635.1 3-carboxy-cis,cis-muconate cycloisomerase [Xylophilus rhododendri]